MILYELQHFIPTWADIHTVGEWQTIAYFQTLKDAERAQETPEEKEPQETFSILINH